MSTQDTVLLERISAKDALTFGLSDTLDTKASIALVVITFLGTQTAWFVTEKHVAGFWLVVQSLSALSLVVAGALALAALWPRSYDTEGAESLDVWASQLNEFYRDDPDAEQKVSAAIARGEIKRAKERIAKNSRLNAHKSDLIEWSFWCSSAAFALNLLTVIELTIRRLS